MPDKYEAEHEYTDAELLALYREALARIPVSGQGYTIAGRTFTMADLQHVREMVEWLEVRISSASGPARNYARLNRPN